MFKVGSFENEIVDSMEKQLISNQLEIKYGFGKLVKAADYLNLAAEIFEKNGMLKEAEYILNILKTM